MKFGNAFGSIAAVAACLAAASAPTAGLAAAPAEPAYARDVAPILFARCAECHRPGGIGPMSLLNHEETRPWAKSIRSSVVDRTMPPWDANPAHGVWKNDISLSDDEIATIVAWVDRGAPLGDPADMPAAPSFAEGWTIGEPDLIVELPETVVPPDGPDLFPDRLVTLEIPEGKWLSAVEILPGDREVLHHVVGFLGNAAMRATTEGDERPSGFDGTGEVAIMSIWAAGTPPTINPPGMGHPLKTSQTATFNMHYHPCGREAIDRTRVGLKFGEGELEKRIATVAAANAGFVVPPGAERHVERAQFRFASDSRIVSLFPHMHLRGKRFEYRIVRPDGSSEILLEVPSYDFGWQWVYYPAEPIVAPAGSIVQIVGEWDNSPNNPNNPNPEIALAFGEETDDEMLLGFMEIVSEEGVELPKTTAAANLAAFLRTFDTQESFLLRLGAMFPIAAGIVLPRDSEEGGFYLDTNNSLALSPVTSIRWDGPRVTAKTILFGRPIAVEGEVAEDGAFAVSFGLPPLEAEPNPQIRFFLRLLSDLKGQRVGAGEKAVGEASGSRAG